MCLIFLILWISYDFAILQDTTLKLGILMLLPAVLIYLSYIANTLSGKNRKWVYLGKKNHVLCIEIAWYNIISFWVILERKESSIFYQVQSLTEKITSPYFLFLLFFICCTARDTRRQAYDIRKTFIKYCIVGWGVPAVAVVLCAVLDFTETFHFGYGLCT